ncbi:MAG: molybdenum ABC transporter ATP-binding protein [Aquisalinus sp.]|nr:molybdenum ABC transporter ATP-binding protein [Aquisalinus sp.]
MSGAREKIEGSFRGQSDDFHLEASFSVPASGVTGVYGPSGCGKTTLLRCLAGLVKYQGALNFKGETWQDETQRIFKKPHERRVGYVFQEPSLFPHLSVQQNLSFGLERAQRDTVEVRINQDEVVQFLRAESLLQRAPQDLSGGERQRIAIGRALLSQPQLLLLDEPLSALDDYARKEIMMCLEDISSRFAIPVFYVSHDMREMERLADTLLLMEAGKVIGFGPLAEVQADPSLPLYHASESAVTILGRVQNLDEPYHLAEVAIPGGTITISGQNLSTGDNLRLSIKASDVSFVSDPAPATSILNCLPGRIVSVAPCQRDAGHVIVQVALGQAGDGARLLGCITRKSCDRLELQAGKPIYAQIKSIAVMR